jgi:hypothetical protein
MRHSTTRSLIALTIITIILSVSCSSSDIVAKPGDSGSTYGCADEVKRNSESLTRAPSDRSRHAAEDKINEIFKCRQASRAWFQDRTEEIVSQAQRLIMISDGMG